MDARPTKTCVATVDESRDFFIFLSPDEQCGGGGGEGGVCCNPLLKS